MSIDNPLRFTILGRVVPYTTRTQRSLHVSERARRYHDSQEAIATQLAQQMGDEPPLSGHIAFIAAITETGKKRRDLSNLIKAVEDAANGIVWQDDSQVMIVHASLCRDSQNDAVFFTVWNVP